MKSSMVAVIGGGFSGTLLSLHLLRQRPDLHVTLIERTGLIGPGLAYGTPHPGHLLNVPAGRMGAFPDRRDGFHQWLAHRTDNGSTTGPGDFVPRATYGAYLRDLLMTAPAGRLQRKTGTVVALQRDGGELKLTLACGADLRAEAAVLALGNLAAPPPGWAPPCWRADPWAPETLDGLAADAPVLLVGSGLTAVDMVISLLDRGHTGPIHAVSRHGWLPLVHAPSSAIAASPALPHTAAALLRHLRGEVGRGSAWRGVIDGLRPVTQTIWQALPVEERRRFLRHLRTLWDIHRHRMAPAVAARIAVARETGQLVIHAGRVTGATPCSTGALVSVQPRGGSPARVIQAARIIACTGPACDLARSGDRLVTQLLDSGMARTDPLGLGLDVTGNGAVLDRDGRVQDGLFALGPLTKGVFWEMTAVPDIRTQCAQVAAALSASLPRSRLESDTTRPFELTAG